MNVSFQTVVIILVYLSMIVELVFFPVPSVVSTYQLFSRPSGVGKGDGLRDRVGGWSGTRKFMLLLIPVAIGVAAYGIPLLTVLFPELRDLLIPVRILEHDMAVILGSIVSVAGRGISFLANRQIRSRDTGHPDRAILKTDGIFRWTRNPITVGMHMTLFGFFLIFPTILLFAGIVIYAGNMHFRILLEEDFLRREFADRYDAYSRGTRRYL